jgi:RNA polymerase sigma factor (sigma-70 family)
MSPPEHNHGPTDSRGGVFATTHWSVVLQAGDTDSPQTQEAMETLCRAYWAPLYACVRRQGYAVDDAQDLTQNFFARLLGKNSLRHADADRGRFRAFLLTALKHFMANEWVKSRAAKRGGALMPVSLDAVSAEESYRAEPVDQLSPERLYERRWAATLLERVLEQLRHEFVAADKRELFEALKLYTWGESGVTSYADLAAQFGMSEGAVKVAAHRLRERYRELLRAEVARTVAEPNEVDDELRHLLSVISS